MSKRLSSVAAELKQEINQEINLLSYQDGEFKPKRSLNQSILSVINRVQQNYQEHSFQSEGSSFNSQSQIKYELNLNLKIDQQCFPENIKQELKRELPQKDLLNSMQEISLNQSKPGQDLNKSAQSKSLSNGIQTDLKQINKKILGVLNKICNNNDSDSSEQINQKSKSVKKTVKKLFISKSQKQDLQKEINFVNKFLKNPEITNFRLRSTIDKNFMGAISKIYLKQAFSNQKRINSARGNQLEDITSKIIKNRANRPFLSTLKDIFQKQQKSLQQTFSQYLLKGLHEVKKFDCQVPLVDDKIFQALQLILDRNGDIQKEDLSSLFPLDFNQLQICLQILSEV